MVEPVPYLFERLRRNYESHGRIELENVAVADEDAQLPFYYLAEPTLEERETLPDRYDGTGAFSRDAVVRHAAHIPDIESRTVSSEVTALTFESLCRRNRVERVDLVLIDTEGHDWRILQSIDLDEQRPRLLIYAHYHLSARDRAAARKHLARHGYETMEEGFDTFCLDVSERDALAETWRALRPAVEGVAAYEQVP